MAAARLLRLDFAISMPLIGGISPGTAVQAPGRALESSTSGGTREGRSQVTPWIAAGAAEAACRRGTVGRVMGRAMLGNRLPPFGEIASGPGREAWASL